jgi:glyoxylase-like metal-dependent hydrolase (beta-lactamase superfamily II)
MSLPSRSAPALLALAWSLAPAAGAAAPWKVATGFSSDWAHVTIDARPLAPHVYLLHGSGGNVLALVGPDGTLLVDDEFAPLGPKLKAKLAELGSGPVRYVINTHYHVDHSGANAFFQKEGALIIAQENCRADMLVSHYSVHWKSHSAVVPESEAPGLTYQDRLTLYLDGEEVTAFHNQPSHTDGDSVVYFRHANVVHLGDVFVNLLYPYIDLATRGTINGYLPVIDEVLALIDDRTKVVPGHGPVATKAELKAYRDMLQTVRDRVAAGVARGDSLEAIIASHPSAEFDPVWASDRVGPEDFTAMVYQSLTGKRLDWSH